MTAIYERVSQSFARQGMMKHLEARLAKVEQGLVEIVLPYKTCNIFANAAQSVQQKFGIRQHGA